MSKDNDSSASYVFSFENDTDLGVFVFSNVVDSIAVSPLSLYDEVAVENEFTSRESFISDVKRKITIETHTED